MFHKDWFMHSNFMEGGAGVKLIVKNAFKNFTVIE
jgi:hypothetical protein